MQLELALRHRLRLARLTASDARSTSDAFSHLKAFTLEKEELYPGMSRWFSSKVTPGIANGERAAVLVYCDDAPIACGIVKRGQHAKLSHVSIHPQFQRAHLGELLFALLGAEAAGRAEKVHFTLPEGLWHDKRKFFSGLAFRQAVPCVEQYRTREQELRCETTFADFWTQVTERIPRLLASFSFGGDDSPAAMLMAIRPDFALQILSGVKTVEVRRRFSMKWRGCKVALYATRPLGRVVGTARISKVERGAPEDVWKMLGPCTGASYRQYQSYVAGCRSVYAITFADVEALANNLSQRMAPGLSHLYPPQSYCLLSPAHPWTAVVAADLLTRSFPSGQAVEVVSPATMEPVPAALRSAD